MKVKGYKNNCIKVNVMDVMIIFIMEESNGDNGWEQLLGVMDIYTIIFYNIVNLENVISRRTK